jgi:hypothetical protein
MTRRTFALAVAATATMKGQTARKRGREIAEKAIFALGGDAFRNMHTRTEIGRAYSFYRDRLSGLSIARVYTKYVPDGQIQSQVLGKKQEERVLLTPKDGYDVTYRGAMPLPDEQLQRIRETNLHDIFYILRLRMNEGGIEFESQGIDVVENQRAEVVDVYDGDNRSVTVWFNANDFIPFKQRYYHFDPVIKDRREEVTRYTKFRDVSNGLMWPYATERERDTEKIFQLFSDKVTVNDALNENLFTLPNDIKMLKPV